MLFCGDLVFNGGTPFLLMGSVAGAIEVLENVVAPLGAADGRARARAGVLRRRADPARRWTTCASSSTSPSGAAQAGVSPLEAARDTDLGRFADWPDAERIVGNLHRAYAELGGTPRGGPIDVFAALGDMVAYNGGAR